MKPGTHRAECTPMMVMAHRVLDRVRDGQNVSAASIRLALKTLGDC